LLFFTSDLQRAFSFVPILNGCQHLVTVVQAFQHGLRRFRLHWRPAPQRDPVGFQLIAFLHKLLLIVLHLTEGGLLLADLALDFGDATGSFGMVKAPVGQLVGLDDG
jgi:hypothetical protein